MTGRAVQAVFFARYTISNFRALYGRLPTKTASTYTKDFLQVLEEAGDALAAVLPASRASDTDITYEWPTGSCSGTFVWRDIRWQMKWPTNDKPLPWTMGALSTEVSVPGNPGHLDPALADAEYSAILAAGTEPWLIGVKLIDDPRRLHVRTYFRNPTAQFADRALSQLPAKVLQAIDALPAQDGSGTVVLPAVASLGPVPELRAVKLVRQILDALSRDPNVLLVGPPGTGKSVALEDLQALYDFQSPAGTIFFDPNSWSGNWYVHPASESRTESLVFHPSYSYENFVAALFPKTDNGKMELEAKPGPLLCLSHWIGDSPDRRALLVLDEFNRGPAAAIFGDALALLDKDKRSHAGSKGACIQRPYPRQAMPVPQGYFRVPQSAAEEVLPQVRLPSSLHIVAAMNSTDRSVAPLDAAMRRRFTVIRVGPDYGALAAHLGLDATQTYTLPQTGGGAPPTLEQVSWLAVELVRALNTRIGFCLGEDFLLGHALLWGVGGASPTERLHRLASAVDSKVVPTLRMTFVDQDEVLAAVLGIDDTAQAGHNMPPPPGTVAYWQTAPAALASISSRRLNIRVLRDMTDGELLQALLALSSNK